MPAVGSCSPCGFQAGLATMGSTRRLAASSPTCSSAWLRGRILRVVQSEYA
jgi:hypothetical protein